MYNCVFGDINSMYPFMLTQFLVCKVDKYYVLKERVLLGSEKIKDNIDPFVLYKVTGFEFDTTKTNIGYFIEYN